MRVHQVTHPHRGDRQRPAADNTPRGLGAPQVQVQLVLPGDQRTRSSPPRGIVKAKSWPKSGVKPVAEAPAHRGIGILGPEHGRYVVEPGLRGGPDHNAHRASLRKGPNRFGGPNERPPLR